MKLINNKLAPLHIIDIGNIALKNETMSTENGHIIIIHKEVQNKNIPPLK
jgi:hypothetical protein